MTMIRRALAGSLVAAAGLTLVACGSSTSSETSNAVGSPGAAEATSSQPAVDTMPSGSTGGAYCGPLQDAYALKPPSGSTATDDELQAFADALEPAALAAQEEGRDDLYEFFALIAQMNADPDAMTDDDVAAAFSAIETLGPEVMEACGVDLMS